MHAQAEHEVLQTQVSILKALAHPVRLRIVQLLADKERLGLGEESCCAAMEVCVCRVNELFDLTLPTVSHHLKVLREAGLVETRRDGIWI
jgi:ArsR family transcriptional regulator, arsenate/arsenite/antimonite-responsive transcriptional repressor